MKSIAYDRDWHFISTLGSWRSAASNARTWRAVHARWRLPIS